MNGLIIISGIAALVQWALVSIGVIANIEISISLLSQAIMWTAFAMACVIVKAARN